MVMTEQLHQIENPFTKDKRKLDAAASTNLVTAGNWLSGNEKALDIFDAFVEKYKPTFSQKLRGIRLSHEIICELTAGIGWQVADRPELTTKTQEKMIAAFESAKALGWDPSYAADAAVIAETNQVPIENVITLAQKFKSDKTFTSMEWSTAISMASATYAENNDYKKIMDTYIAVSDAAKDSETTHCALMQAALQSSIEAVLTRYQQLSTEIIAKKLFKKSDKVTEGSRAFLVLAEVIGNLDSSQTTTILKLLITKNKLDQATATRLILAEANKKAKSPVLNRQGRYTTSSTSKDWEIGLDVGAGTPLGGGLTTGISLTGSEIGIGIPLDGVPGGGGLAMIDTSSSNIQTHDYAVAIRLGDKKQS